MKNLILTLLLFSGTTLFAAVPIEQRENEESPQDVQQVAEALLAAGLYSTSSFSHTSALGPNRISTFWIGPIQRTWVDRFDGTRYRPDGRSTTLRFGPFFNRTWNDRWNGTSYRPYTPPRLGGVWVGYQSAVDEFVRPSRK